MARVLDRVGRWSFTHRGWVLAIWVLLLAATGGGAVASGMQLEESFSIPGTESERAQELVVERLGEAAGAVGAGSGTGAATALDPNAPATSRIVVAAPEGGSLLDPATFQAVLGGLMPLAGDDGVASLADPVEAQAVAPDGSVLYVDLTYTSPRADVAPATVDAIEDAAQALRDAGHEVALSGGPFTADLNFLSASEAIGLAVAVVVLLVTFGSLLAAGMPLLTALVGVGVGAAGVLSLSAVTEISSATLTLGLMLGLAVGIDYALFLLSRHRQQLADGLDPLTSAGRAVGTAGSAVVFAGGTVVIALVGLTVVGVPFLSVMGLAAAATVALAVLVAITLLPALMGFAGERLRPRGRAQRAASKSRAANGRWGRIITGHPVATVLLGTVLLGVIAIPATSLRLGLPDAGREDPGSGDRQAYEMLAEGFGPGFNGPLVALVDVEEDPAALLAAVPAVIERVNALPDVAYAAPVGLPPEMFQPENAAAAAASGQLPPAALVVVIPTTGPDSEETADLVHAIRDLRADVEAQTGATLWVTGAAAANIDITEKLADAFPLFLVLVVGLALVLLLVAFRSVLVPVTAVLGFLLTVAAAFGATVAVYQWGWLADLFGVTSTGPLLSFMPILLVGVLFGLAMDYQVFLVSRMREEHVHGAEPLAAVRRGYAHGSRVVLAAALIMISVFAGFVFSGSTIIGPIAFGMGIGIAFDALVVRMTMIPAVMALLGSSAWWLPRWLDRIVPAVDIEGSALEREDAVPVAEASAR